MLTYLLNTNLGAEQTWAVEKNLKTAVPNLIKIAKLEDIARDIGDQLKPPPYIFVAGPADNDAYLEIGRASCRERV